MPLMTQPASSNEADASKKFNFMEIYEKSFRTRKNSLQSNRRRNFRYENHSQDSRIPQPKSVPPLNFPNTSPYNNNAKPQINPCSGCGQSPDLCEHSPEKFQLGRGGQNEESTWVPAINANQEVMAERPRARSSNRHYMLPTGSVRVKNLVPLPKFRPEIHIAPKFKTPPPRMPKFSPRNFLIEPVRQSMQSDHNPAGKAGAGTLDSSPYKLIEEFGQHRVKNSILPIKESRESSEASIPSIYKGNSQYGLKLNSSKDSEYIKEDLDESEVEGRKPLRIKHPRNSQHNSQHT
jgi:hypothetical protein